MPSIWGYLIFITGLAETRKVSHKLKFFEKRDKSGYEDKQAKTLRFTSISEAGVGLSAFP